MGVAVKLFYGSFKLFSLFGITYMETKSIENKAEVEMFYVSQKVIFYNADEKKFLLLKSRDVDDELYGQWELPGGRINKGEDIDVALEREIVEELGDNIRYKLDNKFELIGRAKFYFPSIHRSVVFLCFLSTYQGGDIKLSEEHTEYKWFTASEIEQDEELKPWLKEFVRLASERIKERSYLNDVRRVSADFENYKRRQKENQTEMAGFLTEKLVMDIVPVLDNFHAATVHVPEEAASSPWVVGIQYIEKQLADVLAGHGVAVIEPKVGDTFDPTMHEAIGNDHAHSSPSSNSEAGRGNEASGSRNQESGEENERKSHGKQVIAKVLQNGYRIGERVIRPAKVTVN